MPLFAFIRVHSWLSTIFSERFRSLLYKAPQGIARQWLRRTSSIATPQRGGGGCRREDLNLHGVATGGF